MAATDEEQQDRQDDTHSRPTSRGRQLSHGHHEDDIERIEDITSTTTTDDDEEEEEDAASVLTPEEKHQEFDGHRPTQHEMRAASLSRSRSRHSRCRRAPSAATIASATGAALSNGSAAPGGAASGSGGQPLARTITRRDTVLSRIRSRNAVPQFTHPLAHVATSEAEIVDFDGKDDPYHPLNWPTRKKVTTTLLYGFVTMSATWASSAYSAGTEQIAREFGVGTQVATLGTTLFLFGFGVGPLLWAPLSEVFGRRVAVMAPMFVASCFSFASATAKDLQTLMLTRFFGAF